MIFGYCVNQVYVLNTDFTSNFFGFSEKTTFEVMKMQVKIQSHLWKLRTQKGFTVRQLAQAAEIADSTLSVIENNLTDPRLSTLIRLSIVLECSVLDLFEYSVFDIPNKKQ